MSHALNIPGLGGEVSDAACHRLVALFGWDEIPAMARAATRSQGADQLVWPGLMRRLDRRSPRYGQ